MMLFKGSMVCCLLILVLALGRFNFMTVEYLDIGLQICGAICKASVSSNSSLKVFNSLACSSIYSRKIQKTLGCSFLKFQDSAR